MEINNNRLTGGLYILILRLNNGQNIKIGLLPEQYFDLGYYLYVGRAKRRLRARIKRHLSAKKKTFWHIDYFLRKAQIVDVLIKSGDLDECQMVRKLCQVMKKSVIPLPRFGASDCRCPGHLIYLPGEQNPGRWKSKLKRTIGLNILA